MRARLGIDVGGTCTDIIYVGEEGRVYGKKLPSRAAGQVLRLEAGLIELLGEQADVDYDDVASVIHGTTVATNAVLQKQGAPTGLITTYGFRDVLELRRIRYPHGFNPFWRKPEPIVPRFLRREVTERVSASGEVLLPLDRDEVRRVVRLLQREGVTSLAVSLLHSYANPVHELIIQEVVESEFPELSLSISHLLSGIAGEYERTSTTAIDAYVKPVVTAYLEEMKAQLSTAGIEAPLSVMQSSGLMMLAARTIQRPVFTLESGPASGVLACEALASEIGATSLLSFDMGGTTAKAAAIEDGKALRTPEYEVGGSMSIGSRLLKGSGYIVRVRAVDVAEVGAGGGSIVRVGVGGLIEVGPESAGSFPGPVCYDNGGVWPTITDVDLILGYLNPEALLGGSLPVAMNRAIEVFEETVCGPMRMELLECAYGAYLIANANMGRAVRTVTSERGRDLREFTLVAYGGAAPVHAAELARSLNIQRVIVPVMPGLFSAVGLLNAPEAHEYGLTVLRQLRALPESNWEMLFKEAETDVIHSLGEWGSPGNSISFTRRADLRYVGQFHELTVDLPGGPFGSGSFDLIEDRFHAEHLRTYGHREHEPVEVVNVWIEARTLTPSSPLRETLINAGVKYAPADDGDAPASRSAYFGLEHGSRMTPIISRLDLAEESILGPCIIEEYDSTIVIPPGFSAALDDLGSVVLQMQDR